MLCDAMLGQAVGAGGEPSPPIPDGCALDAHGHLWVSLYRESTRTVTRDDVTCVVMMHRG